MREILFRGKRLDNGVWITGAYHPGGGRHFIFPLALATEIAKVKVIPETVGQFTGLVDKNGKRIFEGDVVRFMERQLGGKDVPVVEVVEFSEGGFATHRYFLNNWLRDATKGNTQLQGIEVIGNIHDNPELLKDGEDDD